MEFFQTDNNKKNNELLKYFILFIFIILFSFTPFGKIVFGRIILGTPRFEKYLKLRAMGYNK